MTPTLSATRLGARAGVRLFLKCENLQKTGSFKVRGALNKLASLSDAERARGVVTVSAGNHAQAMAWAAQSAGVHAVVVMPKTASPTKVEASRGYGAEVVLHGSSGNESFPHALELARDRGLTFVHPFDDERICAGAGTTGLELLEQVGRSRRRRGPDRRRRTHFRSRRRDQRKQSADSRLRRRADGRRVDAAEPRLRARDAHHSMNTIADGLAAPMTGELNYEIVKRYVDDVIVIDDDAIAEGVRQLLFSAKLLAEPAGAAGVGALLAGAVPVREGERVAAIVSGGNVDPAKLKSILA